MVKHFINIVHYMQLLVLHVMAITAGTMVSADMMINVSAPVHILEGIVNWKIVRFCVLQLKLIMCIFYVLETMFICICMV